MRLALLLHLHLDQPGTGHGKMDGLGSVAPRTGRDGSEPTHVRVVRQAMTAWHVTIVMRHTGEQTDAGPFHGCTLVVIPQGDFKRGRITVTTAEETLQ